MNTIRLFWAELKIVIMKPKVWIPILAVLFIPILYSGMFLWAFWNPYGHTDQLPVAVVNQDNGAILNGKTIHLGNDFVKNLKSDHHFDWKFVKKTEAKQGIKHQKYYMVITIPNDFSKKATTVFEKHPKKVPLYYQVNDNYNFIAAKMGTTGAESLKATLSNDVTKTYTKTLFKQLDKLSSGLDKAKQGAADLSLGSQKAANNMKTLQLHLKDLANSTLKLHEGIVTIDKGSKKVYQGTLDLRNGTSDFYHAMKDKTNSINSLASGASLLNDGVHSFNKVIGGEKELVTSTQQLQDGSKQLASGSGELTNQMTSLSEASQSLSDGVNQVSSGLGQLASQSSQISTELNGTSDKLKQLSTGLEEYMKAHPELAKDPSFQQLVKLSSGLSSEYTTKTQQLAPFFKSIRQLSTGAQSTASSSHLFAQNMMALSSGMNQLNSKTNQLNQGIISLNQGANQLSKGIQTAQAHAAELNAGAEKLKKGTHLLQASWPTILSSIQTLLNGESTLIDGSQKVSQGIGTLSQKSTQLHDGANQLNNGALTLTKGLLQLHQGNNDLASHLGDANKKLNDSHRGDQNSNMFSKPVELNKTKEIVTNYGMGLTPYFLSLGLFVGALIITIVYPLRESAMTPRSGVSWALGKYAMLVVFGVFQAVIADVVILYGLGLKVDHQILFILFSVLTSLTFMAIIQFFVSAFSNPGRFIVIVILILQLTTSGGTYPIELIPSRLQAFHTWLPMTYSIDAFRQLIAGYGTHMITHDVLSLIGFMLTMLVLTIGFFSLHFRRVHYKKQPVSRSQAVSG